MTKTKQNIFPAELKFLNFTAYNDVILAQEDTVWFQIIGEAKTKVNNYRDVRLAWTNF